MEPSDYSVNHNMLATQNAIPSFHQDLLQCGDKILEILLHFGFYKYWLMFGLTEDDLRKIETCRIENILILQ